MSTGGARSPRRWAWWTLLALSLALLGLIVLTTPWSALSGVGRLDAVPGRDFTAAQIARGNAFGDQLRVPSYAALAFGLLWWLLLGLSTAGARLVNAIGTRLRRWPVQVTAAAATLIAIVRVAQLPLDVWRETVLRRYGLSTQDWSAWGLDLARDWLVASVLAAIGLVVLVGLARRTPRWWFAPGAVLAAGLVVAGSYVHPVIVEPLYDDVRPMAAGPLRSSLLDLAHRDGIEVDDVLVADASARTTALNAYVSGFGATRRIVVFDTLVDQVTPAEVRLVVAHELGHVAEQDIVRATTLGALGAAAAVVFLWLVLRSRWLLRRCGARSAGDPAVVALILALVAAGAVLAAPVQSLRSRQVEARADRHALDLTRDVDTFISTQRRLAITNLADLDPPTLGYLWFASHPTVTQRIAIARSWAPGRPHSGTGPDA